MSRLISPIRNNERFISPIERLHYFVFTVVNYEGIFINERSDWDDIMEWS